MRASSSVRTLRALTARDVMRIQMVTVVPEMTVRELAQTLVECGIRSVPVLGPTGKLVGVAALADVARLATRDGAAPSADGAGNERLRVRDVMGPVGRTVLPDEPVPSLVRRFVHDHEQRALVVENDMLLGIVTPVDVLSAIDEGA